MRSFRVFYAFSWSRVSRLKILQGFGFGSNLSLQYDCRVLALHPKQPCTLTLEANPEVASLDSASVTDLQ